jgi:oxygen-independent coproporphyrinogen-3 oxidase
MKSTMEPWSSGMPAYPLAESENSLALGANAVPADAALLQPYFAQIREEKGALILNVHLPFCPSRCLSCDRVAVVEHDAEKLDRYIANLDRELALAAEAVGSESRLARLHFGGGSPNHLSELAIGNLFSRVSHYFTIGATTQVSMELNPRRTSRAQLNFYKGLGIDHIKLEVRDVDALVQREIGRIQSLELLEDVISIAHGVNFESISMDYLIGLPGQTVESSEQSIEAMISLDPDCLVCLPFHRRETAFPHQIAVDTQQLPSLADRLAMFNAATEGFVASGYDWVGLNLFAKPDHQLAVAQREGTLALNVLGYDTDPDASVLGIGLGALSELPGLVVQNHVDMAQWHSAVESGTLGSASAVFSDDDETLRRKVLRGLVCHQRIPADQLTSAQKDDWLSPLLGQGFAVEEDGEYLLTEVGRLVLPHIWTDSSPVFRTI